jgi:hypothetical protein
LVVGDGAAQRHDRKVAEPHNPPEVDFIDFCDIDRHFILLTRPKPTRPASTGTVIAGYAGLPSGMLKRHTKLPVAVGFGVRTAKQARAIAAGADGVVVGSALVGAIKDSLDKNGKATARTVKAVTSLVAELASGMRRGRSS